MGIYMPEVGERLFLVHGQIVMNSTVHATCIDEDNYQALIDHREIHVQIPIETFDLEDHIQGRMTELLKVVLESFSEFHFDYTVNIFVPTYNLPDGPFRQNSKFFAGKGICARMSLFIYRR